MNDHFNHTGARGLTLIECVIAMTILAVAVPSMMLALREVHGKRAAPIMASRASWLAVEKLEDIIADRNSTTRGYAYVQTSNYPAEASIDDYPGFARAVTIKETGVDLLSAGTGFKKVTVTVSWTDPGGVSRSLDMTTVLTDYTP